MRSQLDFIADTSLLDEGVDDAADPSLCGEKLARFLATQLPARGFAVARVHDEDWGWRVQLAPIQFSGAAVTFQIGCGQPQETANRLLCFIHPSAPMVRRWFRKIDTRLVVERLADTLERILTESGKAQELRWWTDHELKARRGKRRDDGAGGDDER